MYARTHARTVARQHALEHTSAKTNKIVLATQPECIKQNWGSSNTGALNCYPA